MQSWRRIGVASRIIALALAGLLISCSAWQGQQIKSTESRIEVIRDILQENWDNLTWLNGSGRLIVESPRQSFSGRATTRIRIPDSAFVKIEALLGVDVALLFADDEHFQIYSPMEQLIYEGQSSDTLNLSNYIGFDFTLEELMHALAGVALIPPLHNVALAREKDDLKITGELNGAYYTILIDTKFGLVSKVVVRDATATPVLIQEFRRFIKVGPVRVPKMIRYIRPLSRQSLTIFYDNLQVNKPLTAKDFYLKLPPDVFKVRL